MPQVVLGPFAGVFVDRWSRKWTMILADSFDVAGAAIACSTLMFVFIPNPEKTETTNNILRDMKEGFQAIRSNPAV